MNKTAVLLSIEFLLFIFGVALIGDVLMQASFYIAHAQPTVIKGTYKEPTNVQPEKREWAGKASYYSEAGCVGCSESLTMANGKRFTDEGMTVAFNRLPLGTFVEVTNAANKKAVTVEVTDRGGFESLGRIIDLSKGVKEVLNCSDLCEVKVKEL
jgi:rare lipoprotein A (peptidoglycan hydrolase)